MKNQFRKEDFEKRQINWPVILVWGSYLGLVAFVIGYLIAVFA